MKKLFVVATAMVMLLATSCKKDQNAPENVALGGNEFLATIDNGANPQNVPRVKDGMSQMTAMMSSGRVVTLFTSTVLPTRPTRQAPLWYFQAVTQQVRHSMPSMEWKTHLQQNHQPFFLPFRHTRADMSETCLCTQLAAVTTYLRSTTFVLLSRLSCHRM